MSRRGRERRIVARAGERLSGSITPAPGAIGGVQGLGPELITNGGFDADLTGWTVTTDGTGSLTWDTGRAHFVSAGAGNTATIEQSVTTGVGDRNRLLFTVSNGNLFGGVYTATNRGGTALIASTLYEIGSYTLYFSSPTATSFFNLTETGGAGDTFLDNVSIRRAA
jgi:hypothetical protein